MVYKFSELASNVLGVYMLKRTIFATIRLQFDDDFHSSPWHSETDWKIVILISGE